MEIHGERSEKVLPAIRHLGDDTQRDVPQATREAEGEATNYQLEVRVAIEHTRIGKVRRAPVRQPAYKNII